MRYLFLISFLFNVSVATCQSSTARKHLSILTSDSLAGRGFIANGQEKASNYIITQLENFGVSAGLENGFKQELSYSVNTFPAGIQFSVENQNTVKIYSAGKHYLFHPASAPIEITGEIKKISPQYKFSPEASNEIYYIKKTEDNSEDIKLLTQDFLFTSKYRGNLLLIQDSSKWSWYPSTTQGNNTVLYIKDELQNDTKIRAINESIFISNFRSSNVIGKIEGENSDSVIMLSAHYDHLGQMGNAIFKGANDNASGVAMLLTIAEQLAHNPPKFDTYFLFTTAEEIGLLGSRYFIENPPFDLKKIKMLVNLDMVGTGDKGITVVNAKKQHQYFDLLQKLNGGRIEKIKERGRACNSDHCLFDQIGIPAVFIYTLGGKQAYHDIYDNGKNLSFHAFNNLHDLIIESLNQY